MEEEDIEIRNFTFTDEHHQDSMLQALNAMRKNKHFCDVILHVSTADNNPACIQRINFGFDLISGWKYRNPCSPMCSCECITILVRIILNRS